MMLVDYGGSVFPIIAHSPWNGVHLADFVMPFFLFIAGISPALVYKVCVHSFHYYIFVYKWGVIALETILLQWRKFYLLF